MNKDLMIRLIVNLLPAEESRAVAARELEQSRAAA
jgi:hypothetical protein